MKITGADILWSCLVEHGVDTVFGYPGGAILPAYDRLLDHPIRHVLVRHEQSAAHMADGYARASGRVGVALATSGPGATNLVTGITLPITKHNFLVQRAEDIAPAIRDAFRIATSGRPGPVLVDITKNAQQEVVEVEGDGREADTGSRDVDTTRREASRASREANATRRDANTARRDANGMRREAGTERRESSFRATDSALAAAADLIARSERPVVLAGHGILKSGAMDQLRELAERADVPVAVTLLGIGALPAEHPLNLGMMGMHGEAWVNQAIQQADLLIALGMRFDDRVTGRLSAYAPHAKKIHVDIDPAEIHKNIRADVGIVGDLREVLSALLPLVEDGSRAAWHGRIRRFAGGATVRDLTGIDDEGPLQAAQVIHDIWRATEGRAIVVTDVGQHQMWAAQYYRVSEAHTWITSGGLGTMGFAVPAAIGAKLARPDREVWAIVGDGGFQMTQAELATLVQEGIKITIAVINNGYLGMVRQWQQFFHDRRYSATPMSSPDFVKIADAHGLPGIHVRCRDECGPAIRHARASAGPVLIDFRVQQEDAVYPMVSPGAALDEMIHAPGTALVETGADLL